MVTHVIEEREAGFVARIRADLAEARRLAESMSDVPRERLKRLEKMNTLAEHVERALRLFIKTSRLDVSGVLTVFRDEAGAPRR